MTLNDSRIFKKKFHFLKTSIWYTFTVQILIKDIMLYLCGEYYKETIHSKGLEEKNAFLAKKV